MRGGSLAYYYCVWFMEEGLLIDSRSYALTFLERECGQIVN